jgi:hypothetical protein
MRRFLIAVVVLSMGSVGATGTGASAGQGWKEQGLSLPRFAQLRTLRGTPSFEDGQFIVSYISAIQEHSATFREMLTAIDESSTVRVLLAPAPGLRDATDGTDHSSPGARRPAALRPGWTSWSREPDPRCQSRQSATSSGTW